MNELLLFTLRLCLINMIKYRKRIEKQITHILKSDSKDTLRAEVPVPIKCFARTVYHNVLL